MAVPVRGRSSGDAGGPGRGGAVRRRVVGATQKVTAAASLNGPHGLSLARQETWFNGVTR